MERNFVENVPYCIYINDIPIPTYQTMWDENRKLREQISRLKKLRPYCGFRWPHLQLHYSRFNNAITERKCDVER